MGIEYRQTFSLSPSFFSPLYLSFLTSCPFLARPLSPLLYNYSLCLSILSFFSLSPLSYLFLFSSRSPPRFSRLWGLGIVQAPQQVRESSATKRFWCLLNWKYASGMHTVFVVTNHQPLFRHESPDLWNQLPSLVSDWSHLDPPVKFGLIVFKPDVPMYCGVMKKDLQRMELF